MAACRVMVNMLIGPRGGDLRISATRVSRASAAARASGENGTAVAGGGWGGRGVGGGVGATVGVGGGSDGVGASACAVGFGDLVSSEPPQAALTTIAAQRASHKNAGNRRRIRTGRPRFSAGPHRSATHRE